MALHDIQNLQIHDGWETSFATAEGSFSARQVRAVSPPTITLAQAAMADPTQRSTISPLYAPILGLKSGSKLTFPTFLRGTGTAAGDGVAGLTSSTLAEGRLLYQAMGGEDSSTGTTVNDASATTTSFDVASAAGLAEGNGVLVDIGGTLEANVIASISGSTVTFLRAFSAAPSNGATVNAGTTYYVTETVPGYLQFRLLTSEGNGEGYWQMLGCVADLKLADLAPGQIPKCNWDVMATSWALNTGVALASSSFTNSSQPPVPGVASELYLGTYGNTTRTVVGVSALDIDPGLTWQPVPSVSDGVEGVQSYVRSASAPTVNMTLTTFEGDRVSDFSAGTAKFLHYQMGSTAGSTVLIEIPRMIPAALPQRSNVNSQAGMQCQYIGVADLTESGAMAQSPIRIHLL